MTDIFSILTNLITPGLLIGFLGVPVIYAGVATDLPKAATDSALTNTILGDL
jgi:hypothetical protein